MKTGVATVLVTLALLDPAVALPGAATPPGEQIPATRSQAALPAGSQQWLQNLKSWLRAIVEHIPGEMDEPATRTGRMVEAELEAVRADLFALLNLHQRLSRRGERLTQVSYRNMQFTLQDIEDLLGLTKEESGRADVSRILKRGAILHGDVEMLVAPDIPPQLECSAQGMILVQDGQVIGQKCSGIHWAQGRALLDELRPDPREDPMVRLWYQATIAYLLERTKYAESVFQIDHGCRLFPTDPWLVFEHGLYDEVLASRSIQAVLQANRSGPRSASSYLEEAEELFRRVLESSPGLIEARVHHGVVLGAMGRHDQAAGELRKAADELRHGEPSPRGRILRYYAEMSLGDEEQALGRSDEAKARYNEASALSPSAQSPWIALSALSRRSGDRTGALAGMRRLFKLPADERYREDPWWSYYRWLDPSARKLLNDLYRPFLNGGQQ